MSYVNLVQVLDPQINTSVNPAEWKLFKNQFADEQRANYERLGRAELVIGDLIRLGILREGQVAELDRFLAVGDKKSRLSEVRLYFALNTHSRSTVFPLC